MTNVRIDTRQLRNMAAEERKEIERLAEDVVKGIAENIVENVIPDTPIDTGHARANWQVSRGLPRPHVRETFDKSAGGRDTVILGRASAAQYKFGEQLWIYNNVHYITLLNQGTSPQALPGFVERAVIRSVRPGVSRGRTRFVGGK